MSFACTVSGSKLMEPCGECLKKVNTKMGGKLTEATVLGDISIVILALVFAILGQTNVIAMPPAAAFALFGLAGFIVLADIATFATIVCAAKMNKQAKKQPAKM